MRLAMRLPMRSALAIMTITVCSSTLSGCGWLFGDEGVFRDRGNDYRSAKLEPVLQVPQGMNNDAIVDEFAIPVTPTADPLPAGTEFTVPRPPKLDTVADAVRLNKLGNKNWILADASPAELWAQVRGFLNISKIPVARADAMAGQIDTDWLQPTNTKDPEERFQFTVDQGVQRGTAEVRVVMVKRNQSGEIWPENSDDPARETVMLRELAQYLADASSTGAISMLAQRGIDDSGRIFFISSVGGSDPSLQLKLPFYRAWASLGSSLTRGQFLVVKSDEPGKTYLVKALPEQEEVVEEKHEDSWWIPDFIEDWTADWTWQGPWAAEQEQVDEAQEQADVAIAEATPGDVTIKEVPAWWDFTGQNTEDFPTLKVTLTMDATGKTGTIRVADLQGKPLDPDQASGLLVRIKNYLR